MQKNDAFFLIAVDGPSGAGKSSIAKELAHKLDFIHVDTGAFYRAIAWESLRLKLSLDNEQEIINLVENATFQLSSEGIVLNGSLLTSELRSSEVTKAASSIARILKVREGIGNHLRKFTDLHSASQNIVMDGRDIGTVVMPHANLKFFITASIKARAHRRWLELAQIGVDADLLQLEKDLELRDQQDCTRQHSPLRQADDAILINTTDLTFDEALEKIFEICRETVSN